MRKRVDRCVGCAECIGCGRRDQHYTALICDCCDEEVEELYCDNGNEICGDCLLKGHMDGEGICVECGDCETLYEGLCRNCFLNDQERVIVDDY